MYSNWINALDACAAGGVLDYDASADLLDKPSRFVGHPNLETLPPMSEPMLPTGTKMKGQLDSDQFQNSDDLVQNPSWKKWVFGGLIALGLGSLLYLGTKGKLHMPKMDSFKNFWDGAVDFAKKPFKWLSGLFKKSPASATS